MTLASLASVVSLPTHSGLRVSSRAQCFAANPEPSAGFSFLKAAAAAKWLAVPRGSPERAGHFSFGSPFFEPGITPLQEIADANTM
jgi:hypothetical protein